MRTEAWLFAVLSAFFVIVAPGYWYLSYDPTGTAALTMTAGLCLLVTFYLWFHSRRMEPRPEDRKEADIAEGAGELGFFPPHSWWPLACGAAGAVAVLGVVFGWWLFIIAIGFGAIAICGWIFEYYVGDYAH